MVGLYEQNKASVSNPDEISFVQIRMGEGNALLGNVLMVSGKPTSAIDVEELPYFTRFYHLLMQHALADHTPRIGVNITMTVEYLLRIAQIIK